jgi:hypothetical protein
MDEKVVILPLYASSPVLFHYYRCEHVLKSADPQDKAAALIETSTNIARIVEELTICPFSTQAFSELLGRIQKTVGKSCDYTDHRSIT